MVFKQISGGSAAMFRADSAQELYRAQLIELLSHGDEVDLKGRTSRELLNVTTIIDDPRRARVHMVPGRRFNPFLALSEALWVLSGRNDVDALIPYNSRITEFSDDAATMYGAYGKRMAGQIPDLVKRLKRQSNDRRAVLSIWRPDDLTAQTADPPCNNLVYFKLRGGRLHMTVICRSNDIHWGLYAVNLCEFSVLQEYIAARLGCELGTQTHFSNSLHVYLDGDSDRITKHIMEHLDAPEPTLPPPAPLFPTGLPRHQEFVLDCSTVLNGHTYGNTGELEGEGVAFLEFASDLLACYRQNLIPGTDAPVRHSEYYADWLLASKDFMYYRLRRLYGNPKPQPA